MKAITDYIFKVIKRKSTYFLAAALIVDIIALILYCALGTNVFRPELSGEVIGYLVAAIVLCVVVAFSPYKLPYAAIYAMQLLACFQYIATQVNLITNVLVGIDGTALPAILIVFVVLTIVSAVLSMVAMALLKEPGKAETITEKTATTEEAA